MGIFDGIKNKAATHMGGNFVRAGHYYFVLDRIKGGVSQKNKAESFVAVEMRALHALEDGDIPVDESFKLLSSENWHRPGEAVTHLMMSKHDSFLGNFKALVSNIGGIPEAEVDESKCEAVTGGLFDGLYIEVRARTTKTRAGKPFTVVSYVREVPATEIKERVAETVLDLVLGKGEIDKVIAAEAE